MGIDTTREHYQSIYRLYTDRRRFLSRSQEEQYNYLKELQGELQAFYLKMRPETEAELTARFGQLIASVRSAMHAAKSMTDIASNIQDLRQSSKDIKFNFFLRQKIATEALSLRLHALLEQNDHGCFETLRTLLLQVQEQFSSALNDFYREARHANLSDLDITSLLNFNRELFTANKAMLMAVKDFLLDEKEAEAIRELPVYAS
jgi:phosphate:Na+ symporter